MHRASMTSRWVWMPFVGMANGAARYSDKLGEPSAVDESHREVDAGARPSRPSPRAAERGRAQGVPQGQR